MPEGGGQDRVVPMILRACQKKDYSQSMQYQTQSLNISIAANSEKPTITRLLQLYLHDFSDFARLDEPCGEVDDKGMFQYEHLDSYWADPGRAPLLTRPNTVLP